MGTDDLRPWAYALVFVAGVFILTATVAGIVTYQLQIAGVELGDHVARGVFDAIFERHMPPLLVAAWGLAAGALVIGAALELRGARGGSAWGWSVAAIVGALASFPVTAGFGVGATLAIGGAGLAMACEAAGPEPDPGEA